MLSLIIEGKDAAQGPLPEAIAELDRILGETEARSKVLADEIDATTGASANLVKLLRNAKTTSNLATTNFDAIIRKVSTATAEQTAAMKTLQAQLSEVDGKNSEAHKRAHAELRNAIADLEKAGQDTVLALSEEQTAQISELAQKVGDESAKAIEKSVKARTASTLAKLELASARANTASSDAAAELEERLEKIDKLASNLEVRIETARERAEDQVDDDFARRVALITESLNSNAIDIGKALSTEVTDTAWASYLRGDRGIFTRRAVNLLSSTEAREIAELYDMESEFREHVSRYIHDFEAMLRTILSARDGNAMSVTLLGSDMGKLYVALAQALERFRN